MEVKMTNRRRVFLRLSLAVLLTACTAPAVAPAGTNTPTLPPAVWTQAVGTATALHLTAATPSATAMAPPTDTATATPEAPTEMQPVLLPTITPDTPTALPPALTATRAPATAIAPLPSPTTAGAPVIFSFTVDKTDLDPGDSLTFNWSTANAITVTFSHILPTGLFGELTRGPQPASGSLTLATSPGAVNAHQFVLSADNGAGLTLTQTLSVRFRCPHLWFFTPAPAFCATLPERNLNAVEQSFENGRLLWLNKSYTPFIIYALYADGSASANNDTWSDGQPESDPTLTPPAGRYQPVRGFGKFWREQPGVRERLGWALAPEQAYTARYQAEFGGVDWKGWNEYVTLGDGRVVHLKGHYVTYAWETVTP